MSEGIVQMRHTTYAQAFALRDRMREWFDVGVTVEVADRAVTVAAEAMSLGLPPVQAVHAAAVEIYPGFMSSEGSERADMLSSAMNGLLAAERVEPLTPRAVAVSV